MISEQEIKYIAKLAKIDIAKKEREKFKKELSSILDYVNKLKRADISNIVPCFHPVEVKNVFRDDVVKKSETSLLKLASRKKGGYIKVKAVL